MLQYSAFFCSSNKVERALGRADVHKGQLILEWLFDVLNFPKNNAKIL